MATESEGAERELDSTDSTITDKIVNFLVIGFLVICVGLIVVPLLFWSPDSSFWQVRGTYGDFFAGTFTAAALAFVAWSSYHQRKELALQRRELALQRQEFKKSVEVFEAQKQEMEEQNALNRNTEIARQRQILFDTAGNKYIREYAMRDLLAMGVKQFSNVDLSRLNFNGFNFHECNFLNTDLRKSNMDRANLTGAILVGADLSESIISDADLAGAILQRTDFRKSNLRKANLSGTDLMGAYLGAVDDEERKDKHFFLGADLTGADLRNANLTDCVLKLAELADADLRGANLAEVNFFQVGVGGAKIDLIWRGVIDGYHGKPLWYDAAGNEFTEDDFTKT